MAATRHNLAVVIGTPVGGSDLKMRMTVAALPVRKGEALQGALIGQNGAGPPYAFSIVSGSLPPGISLNPTTGILSGTPTAVGHYSFLAQVQDSQLAVFKSRFAIDVIPPLTVVAGTPTPMEESHDYAYQFRISGATGAVTWSVASGAEPDGTALDSAGLLSGFPTNPGDYHFVARATDAGSGDSIDIPVTIHVYLLLSVVSNPDRTAYVLGTNYANLLNASVFDFVANGVTPYTSSVVSIADGLSLDTKSGIISGAPTTLTPVSPPSSMTIRVTDAIGATTTVFWAYTVVSPNQALQPKSAGVDVGNAGPYNLNFTDKFTVANDGNTVDVDIADGVVRPYTVASGTDNYTATVAGLTSYTAGYLINVLFTNQSTIGSNATLDINGLGPKAIFAYGEEFTAEADSSGFNVQYIPANSVQALVYDGAQFQIM